MVEFFGSWVPGIENRGFTAVPCFRLFALTWALGHFSMASGTGGMGLYLELLRRHSQRAGMGEHVLGMCERASDAVFLEVGVIKREVYQVSANKHGSSCQGLSINSCTIKLDMDRVSQHCISPAVGKWNKVI
jgi:hypothetical protein